MSNSLPSPSFSDPAPSTTRRQFLRTSATAAAAVSVGALELSRSAHAAGGDTLRLGMIGCGGRNSGAAVQALTADPGTRLVAMCDFHMDRVKARRADLQMEKPAQVEVPDDRCYSGFDGYKHVIENSDVVVIANAAKFHPFHAMAAIKAGKHVFVEKPHGIDPAGIRLMQAACDLAKQKGLSLVSGLQSRYHTGYQETVQRIQDGAVGDIVALQEHWLRAPYGLGTRNPNHTELQWQVSVQYRFRWLSGDDVPQTLVHNIDRVSWVLGNAVPEKCHGLAGRSTMVAAEYGDVFDHHTVIYEFANGVPLYAFCRTTTGCYDNNSSFILGTKGKASLMDCRIWGEKAWRWKGECDPYQREHDVLFAGIRSGKPVNNGDYMARSTMICVMGQISCYTGKEITWDQVNASDFAYAPRPEDCRDGMEPPTKPGPEGVYPVPVPGKTEMV